MHSASFFKGGWRVSQVYLVSNFDLVVGAGLNEALRGEEVQVHPQEGAEPPDHANGPVRVTAERVQGHGKCVLLILHLWGGERLDNHSCHDASQQCIGEEGGKEQPYFRQLQVA